MHHDASFFGARAKLGGPLRPLKNTGIFPHLDFRENFCGKVFGVALQ